MRHLLHRQLILLFKLLLLHVLDLRTGPRLTHSRAFLTLLCNNHFFDCVDHITDLQSVSPILKAMQAAFLMLDDVRVLLLESSDGPSFMLPCIHHL